MYDFCFQLKHLSCVILFHNLRHPYIHFDFEEMIFPLVTSQSIRPKEVLVSFDVVSLFINVPVDLAVAQRKLSTDDTLPSRTNSCIDELVLLRNRYDIPVISWPIHRATFGTAMGSPVCFSVANLVMEDVEVHALATSFHTRRDVMLMMSVPSFQETGWIIYLVISIT